MFGEGSRHFLASLSSSIENSTSLSSSTSLLEPLEKPVVSVEEKNSEQDIQEEKESDEREDCKSKLIT